eukprot:gene27656-30626_t
MPGSSRSMVMQPKCRRPLALRDAMLRIAPQDEGARLLPRKGPLLRHVHPAVGQKLLQPVNVVKAVLDVGIAHQRAEQRQ